MQANIEALSDFGIQRDDAKVLYGDVREVCFHHYKDAKLEARDNATLTDGTELIAKIEKLEQ